ncbi:MAG: hypothetical protein ACXWPM_10090 [Bdellovibrionota bacterium]
MRGFRGSRAAQNAVSSRYGNFNNHHQNQNGGQNGIHGQSTHSPLPDWMKTPETRAREQQERLKAGTDRGPVAQPREQKQQPMLPPRPALRAVPQPIAHPRAAVKTASKTAEHREEPAVKKARPALKVIAGGAKETGTKKKTASASRAAVKKRAAPAKSTARRKAA